MHAIAGTRFAPGPLRTVLETEPFGWIKFDVTAENLTLILARTEAGEFTATALTDRISQYRASLHSRKLHQVRTITNISLLLNRTVSRKDTI